MEKKTLMAWVIIVVMVLSVVGFVLVDTGPSETKKRFGDYTFYRTREGWRSEIGGQEMFFNYVPDQVAQIAFDDKAKQILTTAVILAVSYDPNDRSAQIMGELQYYVEQLLNENGRVFVLRGLTNTSAYPVLPELSCRNASQNLPVIVFEHANSTQVIAKDWCMMVQAATSQDLFLLTDRVLFTVLGVL